MYGNAAEELSTFKNSLPLQAKMGPSILIIVVVLLYLSWSGSE